MDNKKILLIQGAMDVEIQYIIDLLRDKRLTKIAEYEFYEGTINNMKIVASKTSIGIINVTMATTIGIEKFNPDIVVNQGTAGAHREDLHIGDVIIGEKCYNINAYKMPMKGKGEGSNPFEWKLSERAKDMQPANMELVDAIEKSLKSSTKNKIYRGILGSGDVFSREYDRITWINNTFNNLCEDMESIGTYHVCNKFNIPCVGVRIISNNELLAEKFDEQQAIELQKILVKTLNNL